MKARNIWGDFGFKIKRLKNATYNDLVGCGLMRLKIQKKNSISGNGSFRAFVVGQLFFLLKRLRIFSLVVKFSKGVTNAHY